MMRRREFIRNALAVSGAVSLPVSGIAAEEKQEPSRARVAWMRDAEIRTAGEGGIEGSRVARLVYRGVCRATGCSDENEAWKSLFRPGDRVSIKVNCLAGARLSSHVAVVEAVVQGLLLAGVSGKNILVWERREKELEGAGFRVGTWESGVRCAATDSPGFGYEARPQISGTIGSCFSRIVSEFSTALVNVPVLKDHDLSGVSIGMKNFYGAIHNPNKYHENGCDPYIADLNRHPAIRDKLRLVVCDALLAQFHGGPAYVGASSWKANGVLVSRDPVALDRVGESLISEKRKEAGLASFRQEKREPNYIATAARRGLGVDDPDRIQVFEE